MASMPSVAITGLVDRDSAEWLRSLRAGGAEHEAAAARLHALLTRVAFAEVRRRRPQPVIDGPELDDVAHQAAADALVSITGKLDQFRGESRFTTWACKFVMFEVSNKLGRHFWRRPNATLDAEDWDQLPARFGFDPGEHAEWRELIAALHRAVDEALTERQRRMFVAIVLNGAPLDTVVSEWDTNRNAIYQTLFDARSRLRAALVAGGHLESVPGRTT
jgi:RNA polymerase sigma-70 factor (ECF subfamily)